MTFVGFVGPSDGLVNVRNDLVVCITSSWSDLDEEEGREKVRDVHFVLSNALASNLAFLESCRLIALYPSNPR